MWKLIKPYMNSLSILYFAASLLPSLCGQQNRACLDDIELGQVCLKEVRECFINSFKESRSIKLERIGIEGDSTVILVEIKRHSFLITTGRKKTQDYSTSEKRYDDNGELSSENYKSSVESISNILTQFRNSKSKEVCVILYETDECEFLNRINILDSLLKIKQEFRNHFLDNNTTFVFVTNDIVNYIENQYNDRKWLIRLKTNSKDLILVLEKSYIENVKRNLESAILRHEKEKISNLGKISLNKSSLSELDHKKMFILVCFERFKDLNLKSIKNGVLTKHKDMILFLLTSLMSKKRFKDNFEKIVVKATKSDISEISKTLCAYLKQKKEFTIYRENDKRKLSLEFYKALLELRNEPSLSNICGLRFICQIFTVLVKRFDLLTKVVIDGSDEVPFRKIDGLKAYTKKYWVTWFKQFINYLQHKRLAQKNKKSLVKANLREFKDFKNVLRKFIETEDFKTVNIPLSVYTRLKEHLIKESY